MDKKMINLSKHYINLEKGAVYLCGTWDTSVESEALSVLGCLRAGATIITLDKATAQITKGMGLSHKTENMDIDQWREAIILAGAAAKSGEPVVIAFSLSRSHQGGAANIEAFLRALVERCSEREIPLFLCAGPGTPWLFSLVARGVSQKKESLTELFPYRPSDGKNLFAGNQDGNWLVGIMSHPLSPLFTLSGAQAMKQLPAQDKPFMALEL